MTQEHQSDRSFATRALHGPGRKAHPNYTAASTPIYPSAWFIYDDLADMDAVFADLEQALKR